MAQKNTTHEYNVSPSLNQLVIWAKLWPVIIMDIVGKHVNYNVHMIHDETCHEGWAQIGS